MSTQAGKGSKLRQGANLSAYWNNYPFPEKLTVTQWIDKLGFGDEIDMKMFDNIPTGRKITEEQFSLRVKFKEEESEMLKSIKYYDPTLDMPEEPQKEIEYFLSSSDLEKLKDDMSSMSFSEFQKIKKKTD